MWCGDVLIVPRSSVKAFHKCDSNWWPRSVVTVEGCQIEKPMCAQILAPPSLPCCPVWGWPQASVWSGPCMLARTRSHWRKAMDLRGLCVPWRNEHLAWQRWRRWRRVQCYSDKFWNVGIAGAHFRTSELIPGQTNRLFTSRWVAQIPGREREWKLFCGNFQAHMDEMLPWRHYTGLWHRQSELAELAGVWELGNKIQPVVASTGQYEQREHRSEVYDRLKHQSTRK